MRLAILGGSFNPVHVGHLFLADTVLNKLDYERVILIPAFQSPLKTASIDISAEDRLAMLAASVCADPRLGIDDCEIRRAGLSYTIDTLIDFIERYRPQGKPGLILGNDLASAFTQWKDHEKIAALADIIIARRLSAEPSEPESFPCPHIVLNNEIMDISSRQIREKIGSAEAWHYLVPPGARCIIEDRRLYALKDSGEKLPTGSLLSTIARIESDVRAALGFDKFIHSRNTALLAWDLCRRFGLDPQKGYLAGIAHDLCKNLSDEKLIALVNANGGTLSELEQKKPSLLHAKAAALVLSRNHDIHDKDILEAVRCHTTGEEGMGSLAKVVYIADKIEISRSRTDPALREMSRSADLDELFAAVLDSTVAHLRSRHLDISFSTKKLLTAMNKRGINHDKNQS
ncbi:MAG: nicotinate (nicotinamide) nucleotide adenylyltransferase [Treponema sp.]|nr:nicotinate (nicotinamide) nucleotide adenylyltransferase [Treponema sp.]